MIVFDLILNNLKVKLNLLYKAVYLQYQIKLKFLFENGLIIYFLVLDLIQNNIYLNYIFFVLIALDNVLKYLN